MSRGARHATGELEHGDLVVVPDVQRAAHGRPTRDDQAQRPNGVVHVQEAAPLQAVAMGYGEVYPWDEILVQVFLSLSFLALGVHIE